MSEPSPPPSGSPAPKEESQPAARSKPELSGEEQAKLLVEMWKQTVTVQQHFNDLSWRIRSLALTALTFTLGAAAVAAQKAVAVRLFDRTFQLSALIIAAGLGLWLAFFYVDRLWYHPLLRGSVKHGESLEKELQAFAPVAGLTLAISEISPYTSFNPFKLKKVKVHSGSKLTRFYTVVTGLLVVFGLALQVGAPPSSSTSGDSDMTTPSEPSSSNTPSTSSHSAAPTGASTDTPAP